LTIRRQYGLSSFRSSRAPLIEPWESLLFQPDVQLTANVTKLSENVNPEIDRYRYNRDYDNQNDKQWRYLGSPLPKNIKNDSVCDSDDDSSEKKSPQKEIVWKNNFIHDVFTPPTSAGI
jgi:hypothetical protein